jgi:hypothetical protein
MKPWHYESPLKIMSLCSTEEIKHERRQSMPDLEALIEEASNTHGVPKELIRGIIQQESSGNHFNSDGTVLTSSAGALGAMQLMPETAQGLGVNPNNPRENILGGTKYFKQQLEAFNGDVPKALAAYNAGPGAVQEHGGIPPYQETKDYVERIMGNLNGFSLSGLVDRGQDSFGAHAPTSPTNEPIPYTYWEMTKNRFLDSWYDSGTVGMGRVMWAGVGTDRRVPLSLTQADIDYVNQALPGDLEGQRWVLSNAENSEHLLRLTKMKQEDMQRRERIDAYKGGIASIPQYGATLAGALLSDPTILIPLGQEAVLAKALGRLGGSASKVALTKFARYSELAATNALINVGERKVAEKYGGYKQDYEAAALIGGIAGAGLGAFGDFIGRNKSTRNLMGKLDNAETHAVTQAMGLPTPSELRSIREDVLKMSDRKFGEGLQSPSLSKLMEDGKVAIVSRKELEGLAKDLGRALPANVKALHKADEGLTLIVKDALKPGDNIENLLAHEIGVHGNLKETWGEKHYNAVRDAVLKRIEKPKGAWLDAVKSVPGGGWEEVLGHWIERGQQDKVLSELRKGVSGAFKKLGGKADLSDVELRDFVKRSLQNEVEKTQGYRTLPDGSVIALDDNIKFSAANVLNPNLMSHILDVEPGAGNIVSQAANWVSRKAEASRLYGTVHGILSNSVSKHGKEMAAELFHDPRQRPRKDGVPPIERQKEWIMRQLQQHWGAYLDTRMDYLQKTIVEQGPISPGRFQDFNKQVRECYNATYTDNTAGLLTKEWDPAVVKAAHNLSVLRSSMIDIAKKSSEMFGAGTKNLLPKEWKALDDEMWRAVDDDKWLTFVNKFNTMEDCINWLENYAQKAIKRDKIEEKLLNEKTVQYNKDMKAWELKRDKAAGRMTKALPDKPEKPSVTPEEVEVAVNESARKWAVGVGDQNLSNLDIFKEGSVHELSETLHFLQERVPMDTTKILETPWGEPFSYDIHLRSNDLDRIVPMNINRFAGEAALRNFAKDTAELTEKRALFASDLAKAEKFKHINPVEVQRNLEAFDEGLTKIRGLRRERDVKGQYGAFVNLLKGISYAQNGSMMGANQIGELSGAIAYVGFKAVTHLIPSVDNFMRALRVGDQGALLIKEAERQVFGATLERSVWKTDWQSRQWQEASTKGDLLKYMDKVQTGVNFASRVVSSVSMLPKLTDNMLRGIRKDTMQDTFDWAAGKVVGPLRNPFSDPKMNAAGLNKVGPEEVKVAINKYAQRDSEGIVTQLNLYRWQKEDPGTYNKWKTIIDNQSLRALQQNTIGNHNLLSSANNFTKMMFQFKDFSMKVMNGQLARIMTHHEIDDVVSLMLSMATNTMVYAGLTHAKAWARFSDDEGKRQEYLEDRLSPQNLARAALLRSVLGTGLSFGQDIYEATTGSQSFRTTVDRSSQFSKRPQERSFGQMAGDFISQFPAVRAGTSIADTAYTGYKAVKQTVTDRPEVSKGDLRDVFRTFPLQNWLPMVKLTETLVDESDLPNKIRKR